MLGKKEREEREVLGVTCSILVGKMLVVINCVVSRNFITLLGSYST